MTMANCNATELLAEARHLSGLSEKQLDMAVVVLLRRWTSNTETASHVLWHARRFQGLNRKQLLIAWAQLLCRAIDTDPPTTCSFSYIPASSTITWQDAGVPQSGNLSFFTSNADIPSVWNVTLNGQGITSAACLSGLISLRQIDLSNNLISSVDIDGCSSLLFLDCYLNPNITGLSLIGATALTSVNCAGCSIAGPVDVSVCPAITFLDCSGNGMLSASVDTTLASLVTANVAGAGIAQLGGTNQSPTLGVNNVNKLLLEANGWTVQVTP